MCVYIACPRHYAFRMIHTPIKLIAIYYRIISFSSSRILYLIDIHVCMYKFFNTKKALASVSNTAVWKIVARLPTVRSLKFTMNSISTSRHVIDRCDFRNVKECTRDSSPVIPLYPSYTGASKPLIAFGRPLSACVRPRFLNHDSQMYPRAECTQYSKRDRFDLRRYTNAWIFFTF